MHVTKNMGDTDRVVRVAVGIALIGLTLAGQIGAWGWLGVVPIATAAIGWCPANVPFGLNTCRRPS
jgi:hypothetical protein